MTKRAVEQEPELEARERYRELLEELRTIQPGVQVLFAFLLTAPFSQRFSELDDLGRGGYLVALVLAAVSVALFLAPTSFHRVAPRDDREHRIRVAVRLTIVGMLTLLISITSALFVVTRFIFGTDEAVVVAVLIVGLAGLLWYLLPLRRRFMAEG
jgi:amino acid transporter